MRTRRRVLATSGLVLAGCSGDRTSDYGGFRRALGDRFDVQALSRERETWVLEYHADAGAGAAADARRLAPVYAEHVPAPPHRALSVTALTPANSLVSDYTVPADLARDRRAGRLDASTYRDRVAALARAGRP